MARERQKPTIRAWPAKYYPEAVFPAGNRHPTEVEEFRKYFLSCVARRTPKVLKGLAVEVLPAYHHAFWQETKSKGLSWVWLENGGRRHAILAHTWFHEQTDNTWWSKNYESVRDPLLAWINKYQLRAEWVLHTALDTLCAWSRDLVLSEDDPLTAAMKRNTWNAWYLLPPRLPGQDVKAKTFEYPAWDGYDERRYKQVVQEAWKQHLDDYMNEVRLSAVDRTPARLISKPERFDMLALHLCRAGITLAEIATQLKVFKDPTAISRDIQEAGKLIGLPIRTAR